MCALRRKTNGPEPEEQQIKVGWKVLRESPKRYKSARS